ncbi:MAG: nitroreductase family protein [Planctomycetota bacterium]|jgi:nitroreductase|nr:nitroreductase family protein [Planctomycetota bacterium]
MNVYEAMNSRYSVRSYQDREVEDDKLNRILEAARIAPTARNRQEWKTVVIKDAESRKTIARTSEQEFLAGAPVILAVVGLTPGQEMSCLIPIDPVDCSIVLTHIALAAVAEDLGTCWIGHFDQERTCELLGVKNAEIVGLMPLGYPAGGPHPKERKSLDALVRYEKFS